MTEIPIPDSDDRYNLHRFIEAQLDDYFTSLAEIREGKKRSHWMWYIFPQYKGLGQSATSQHFAIQSLAEARAYLEHPVLGTRLLECCDALLELEDRTAHHIFGSIDKLKLRSSMTLFAQVSPMNLIFQRVIDKYFRGQPDNATLELISNN